ncbi:efflux RND transporter periplasmic adaptor subunit [Pontivivens ytuae]|uniref:HlyD family efflux transporter periplasmic adaptor subunit n=1 Tax=Pontivivens ytuae TaxID=2789856 RepID=A0A7S9LPC4_9RHOB|nr:HlyD family efflux transporter periplasmic adaptor subunit [Pontivivens ytuae]QPH52305.1 HlyD family efflux transporter periplasmic adaptor subunit [Pontivivens ytuae]
MRFLLRGLLGLFLVFATVGLIAIGAITLRDARQAEDEGPRFGRGGGERSYSVALGVVENGRAEPVIQSYGEVEGARILELRAPATGTITELAEQFTNGSAVEEGELLYQIDPAEARTARDRAETELREAQATLTEARAALELAEDELVAAELQRDLRRAALARQRNLEGRGVGTAATTEEAELSLSQSEQTVVSRRQAVLVQESAIARAEISVARSEIALADAERTLSDTRVTAPFPGLLDEVTAVLGRRVSQNEQVGELIDPAALDVAFQVTNAQFARLLDDAGRLAELAVIVSLDLDGVPFEVPGLIERAGAQVAEGQTGRLIYARIVDQGTAVLRPGDFVSVRIAEPPLENVAVLPASALTSRSELLIADEDNRLSVVPVRLLRRQGDDVIVADAPEGARYVREVRPQLGPGIRIEPVERPEVADAVQVSATVPEMIALAPDRRARLRAFVEGDSSMPPDARSRMLGALEEDEVPRQVVERLERRMGG